MAQYTLTPNQVKQSLGEDKYRFINQHFKGTLYKDVLCREFEAQFGTIRRTGGVDKLMAVALLLRPMVEAMERFELSTITFTDEEIAALGWI